ncbi:hypothetical protein C8J56DRAFT_995924, partial [Mycena floridula]
LQPTGVEPVFHGFVHMVLFVQPYIEDRPSNMSYRVDVSRGVICPILLEQNRRVMGASPSERHVLRRIARTDSSLESWTKDLTPLEQYHSESWTSPVMYSFIEDEFFVNNFENFNYSLLGLRTS